MICVVTGHYTSVKFDWVLIVDQLLTSVGEMHFIASWSLRVRQTNVQSSPALVKLDLSKQQDPLNRRDTDSRAINVIYHYAEVYCLSAFNKQ